MKKVLGLSGLVVMAVAVFVTTKNVDRSKDVKLSSMVKLTNANAECFSSIVTGWNDGTCSFGGNCFWNTGVPNCATSGGF